MTSVAPTVRIHRETGHPWPQPYEFIGELAIYGPNPYEFIRKIVIGGTKPYEFTGKLVCYELLA